MWAAVELLKKETPLCIVWVNKPFSIAVSLSFLRNEAKSNSSTTYETLYTVESSKCLLDLILEHM